MFGYTPVQLLFFFFVYCFFGWIIETTWVSMHQKKFVNRGFMYGPFIPIYGFGAMALLLSGTPLLKYPVAVFVVGTVVASILEYFTGMAMEAIFKVRYWDYSQKKFNLNGHICLFNSLCWGVLALGLDYVVHMPIKRLSEKLAGTPLEIIVMILTLYFASDLSLSFKAAFDLRALLIKAEKVKDEMRILQKRLDVMIAYANEDFEDRKEMVGEKIDDFTDAIEDKYDDFTDAIEAKLETLKKFMETNSHELADNVREEYSELRDKFAASKQNGFGLAGFKAYYSRRLIEANPSMASKKFKETLENVKAYVSRKDNI